MDSFTITTLITRKDYTNYMIHEIYRKPYYLILTFMGLILIAMMVLQKAHVANFHFGIEMLFYGLVLLVIPLVNILMARKIYNSSESLNNEIKFTFSEEGIAVTAFTYDGFLKWNHIIMSKEVGDFLLLYSSKKSANFIKKDNLTKDQIDFIKSKIG